MQHVYDVNAFPITSCGHHRFSISPPPYTDKNKKVKNILKLLLIAGSPISAVCGLSIFVFIQVDHNIRSGSMLNEYIGQSNLINKLTSSLQRERGMTCLLLSSGKTNKMAASHLENLRSETDNVMMEIASARWTELIRKANESDMISLEKFTSALNEQRQRIEQKTGSLESCLDSMSFYTKHINILIYNAGRVFYSSHGDGKFWGTFDALRMILSAEEMFGRARALGGALFANGNFPQDLVQYFLNANNAGDLYLEEAAQTDPDILDIIEAKKIELEPVIGNIHLMMDDIINNRSTTDEMKSIIWFYNMTNFSAEVVTNTQYILSEKLSKFLDIRIQEAQYLIYITGGTIIVAIVICLIMIWLYIKDMKKKQEQIDEVIGQLIKEKKKTDAYLNQNLPREIIEDIKAGRPTPPQEFDECTVFFSDIVGFTSIVSKLPALDVINLLNSFQLEMDKIIEHYNVYRVEIIGDAYLIVSGLPTPNGKNHSSEIATMALHMVKVVSNLVIPFLPDDNLKMRIGISTGSCAAGVVGLKMLRYCIFGDTVNTASRMESTGAGMRIQVTKATKEHIEHWHGKEGFVLMKRGELDIKGKGKMTTYWLKSKKDFPFVIDMDAECEPSQKLSTTTQLMLKLE